MSEVQRDPLVPASACPLMCFNSCWLQWTETWLLISREFYTPFTYEIR